MINSQQREASQMSGPGLITDADTLSVVMCFSRSVSHFYSLYTRLQAHNVFIHVGVSVKRNFPLCLILYRMLPTIQALYSDRILYCEHLGDLIFERNRLRY